MGSFKDMVERDVSNVFQNTNEFAELHHVIYNDISYDIPIILDLTTEKDRPIYLSRNDNAQGIFLVTTTMYAAYADMNLIPEKDQIIWIGDDEYKIVTSACEMGQIVLGLERYAE